MLKYLYKYIVLYPLIKINTFLSRAYYLLVLNFNNVQYSQFPQIRGLFKIRNKGKVELGRYLVFNSTFASNPIGLSKYCTIFVDTNATLVIGDYSGFSGVSIFCSKEIIIGKKLFCGGNVCIWDTDFHPISSYDRINDDVEKTISKRIIIGDNVFIGANSIILKGVNIGEGSVIGAGSVVTRSIPENQIWAGNPAKFIRIVNSDVK